MPWRRLTTAHHTAAVRSRKTMASVRQRTYAHLFAEAEELTPDVLDAAWAVPEETGVEAESSAASGRIPESRRAGASASRLRA